MKFRPIKTTHIYIHEKKDFNKQAMLGTIDYEVTDWISLLIALMHFAAYRWNKKDTY